MIEFSCSLCHGRMQAPDNTLGYYTVCAHCGHEVVVQDPIKLGAISHSMSIEQKLNVEMNLGGGRAKALIITIVASLSIYSAFYIPFLEYIDPNAEIYRLLAVGWVPFAVVAFMVISFVMLGQRFALVRANERALKETYLTHTTPLNTDVEINEAMLMIQDKARQIKDVSVAKRVIGALTRFKHTRSIREAEDALTVFSERAYNEMDAGYTILRVIVWATPLLGFVGTVQGVSKSVGGLAKVLGGDVEDVSQITTALGKVTSELAFAFDTTLVALVAVIIIMIAMTMVETVDSASLDRIEDYIKNQVLQNLPVKVNALKDGQHTDL
ncbi:Conserved domain protein [hydrothermal vent metagenome]|uniref:Conserved domain protein n=1 Tax=hydrothermal vent metagenome TaxID=652676 RepID=A0A1W1D6K5_9ZZZZ